MERLRIPVDEYTTPSPVTADKATPIKELMNIMHENGIRHIPVTVRNRAVGIISDRDIRLIATLPGAETLTAGDVMIPDPYTVETGTELEQVVFEMSKNKIGSAIITDRDRVVGIFTATDAMNALIEVLRGDVPAE